MFLEPEFFSPAPSVAPQFKPLSSLTWMSALPASDFIHTICCAHRSHPKSEPVIPLLRNLLWPERKSYIFAESTKPFLISPQRLSPPSLLFTSSDSPRIPKHPRPLRTFALGVLSALLSSVCILHSLTSAVSAQISVH